MRVLFVGGTGSIGPHVARQLYERGDDVTLFHRGQHESDELPEGVRHVRSEHASIPVESFPPVLLRGDFDVVVHMIPMGEADAKAAVEAFGGRANRLVALSSGDVYRAYGRFIGLESGPCEKGLLTEDSPLRQTLYPYRKHAKSSNELNYYYDKMLVEREVLSQSQLPTVVLRLPKVYGRGDNANLSTIYGSRNHPNWRWTHGYVENVAAAISLAAVHENAAGHVYNVGEVYTPTVAERLQNLPPSAIPAEDVGSFNYQQDIAYDTTRIRKELGYCERVSYEEGIRRTLRLPK